MYICLDCGQTFDEPMAWVERHGLERPPYEERTGCPYCAGAYTEAAQCEDCDLPELPENLYGGFYCGTCLADSIDFMTALDYLSENDYLLQFVFETWFSSTVPEIVSDELRKAVLDRFMRIDRDCRIRNDTSFMSAVKWFILEQDGDCGKDNYASWLHEYRQRPKIGVMNYLTASNGKRG